MAVPAETGLVSWHCSRAAALNSNKPNMQRAKVIAETLDWRGVLSNHFELLRKMENAQRPTLQCRMPQFNVERWTFSLSPNFLFRQC